MGAQHDDDDRYEDDDYDFPPALHPGRELFTFSLFVIVLITALVWAGWKLWALLP